MSATFTRTVKRLRRPYKIAHAVGCAGKDAVLDLVLPPTCRLCNQPTGSGQDFCVACLRALTLSEPMMRSACLRCGRPSPKVSERATDDEAAQGQTAAEQPCVQCRGEKFAFSAVVGLWSYQDRVCEAVVAAKYGHQSALAASLGRRLGKKLILTLTGEMPDFVTFVPSHLTRYFQRGGNGNQSIAAGVCSELRQQGAAIRCRPLLRMTRRVQKQAWLDNQQRRANVRGAFALKKSYAFAKTAADQHILLVDDVVTTGATASEVSRVLLAAGAKSVTLAVVARAIRS
jgi:predicted amidophosphoribosyltransferase